MDRRRALLATSQTGGGGKEIIEIWLETINNGRITKAYASKSVASDIYAFGDDDKRYLISRDSQLSSDQFLRGSTTIYGLAFYSVSPTINDAKEQIEDETYIYKAVNK